MDWFPWSMLQEEYALISCSFWEEALLLAHICFRTALLPAQSKPHPWEARRTSRRWRTRSSCSEIVAGTNKDHHSSNERHTAIWLSKISRFILDLLSHEYFLRIPQALAAPLAYIPLQRVSRTDTRLWVRPRLPYFKCFALPHCLATLPNLPFHTTTWHLRGADICLCPLIVSWDLLSSEALMISDTCTRRK